MAKKKIKQVIESHPITMLEWDESIELLKRNPEYFGIPESLVHHIVLSEYNIQVPVSDDAESDESEEQEFCDMLVLEISLATTMGGTFAKGNILLGPELTKELMLDQMANVIEFLIELSGHTDSTIPDGGWITDDIVAQYAEKLKDSEIN